MLDHKRKSYSCNLAILNIYKLSFAIEMQMYIQINIGNANFGIAKWYQFSKWSPKTNQALGSSELLSGFFFPVVTFRAIICIPRYLEIKYYSKNSNHVRKVIVILTPTHYKKSSNYTPRSFKGFFSGSPFAQWPPC